MPQADNSGPRGRRGAAMGILACAALAAALRFFHLGSQSLWVDEMLTAQAVAQPWSGIWHASIGDNNCPPLYFLLVKAVAAALGDSEWSLRLLSAASGSLSAALVSCLVLSLGRRTADALAAGFLTAIHPLHIWFSQEARPYALMLFFGLLALLAAGRARETNRPADWALFLLSSLLAFFSHVTGIAFVAIAWLWLAFERPGRKAWIGIASASALFAAAAVPMAAYMASIQVSVPPPRAMTGLELPYALHTLVAGFSLGPSVRELQIEGGAALRGEWVAVACVAAVWVAVAVFAALRRGRDLWPWLAALAVPLAIAFAIALLRDFPFNVRYAVASVVGITGLAACVAADAPRLPGALLLALVAAVTGAATVQWFCNPRYAKDDARSAVQWIARHAAPGSVIAVAPLYAEPVVEYYAKRAGLVADIRPAESAKDLAEFPRVDALVLTRRQHVARWEELQAFARRNGAEPRRAEFPGFEVLLLNPDGAGPI
jgi:mannosyltransferase